MGKAVKSKYSQQSKAKSETDESKSKVRKKTNDKRDNLKWDKLDNTANLFPVIANESVSNVYRISVDLNEDIDKDTLQQALDKVLPYFQVFNSRLKQGIFWYYFETNKRPAPRVTEETTYPCLYIEPYANNEYLFRVTYYKKRINLEVFHVVTDGNGAIQFLKEIVYQYLRSKYPEISSKQKNRLNNDTSLMIEDSYLKNYKQSAKKGYKTEKAYIVKGEYLPEKHFGIIHGHINLEDIKRVSKQYGVTINQYIVAMYCWAVYRQRLLGKIDCEPISVCVPVNLRPFFNSDTMKNFFAVVSAVFKPVKEEYSFEEVLEIISDSLKTQINKENLEKLFSYNVSNEKKMIIRAVPLFVKNIAMKTVYRGSARANTATVTNMGAINVADEYKEYIQRFYVILSMSKGQNLKGGICSYKDTLIFTFSSAIRETDIQQCFFKTMSEHGIRISIESNGVYYD